MNWLEGTNGWLAVISFQLLCLALIGLAISWQLLTISRQLNNRRKE